MLWYFNFLEKKHVQTKVTLIVCTLKKEYTAHMYHLSLVFPPLSPPSDISTSCVPNQFPSWLKQMNCEGSRSKKCI